MGFFWHECMIRLIVHFGWASDVLGKERSPCEYEHQCRGRRHFSKGPERERGEASERASEATRRRVQLLETSLPKFTGRRGDQATTEVQQKEQSKLQQRVRSLMYNDVWDSVLS